MCLGIPGEIVEFMDDRPDLAKVDVSGVRRAINIGLLSEEQLEPGDRLLTLSTCLDEDRLVILARRQREGEKTASLREIVNMAVRQ